MVLFAFFGIWETTLLAGAGAVSVPIIIHLLNRRRYRIVTWAAMRFLLAAQKQNTRRMRLEQLILLLVRCALVALIVFAMASVMPWAESGWAVVFPDGFGKVAGRGHRAHHVLVLDGSLSMNAQVEGKPAFEHARQLAIQKVQSCPAGDGFSVLLLKDAPVWIVGEASQDGRKVVRELEAVRPSHGNASVPSALGMVAAKLGEAAGRFPAQAVYFFTDLQRATWQGAAPSDLRSGDTGKEKNPYEEIQKRASTVFVDVGRDETANLAVTHVDITDEYLRESLFTAGARVRISALVENFGTEKKENVRVELLVGKARAGAGDPEFAPRVVDHQLLTTLNPRLPQPVVFEQYKFPTAGTYAVQVRIAGEDALELDDSRAFVLTVKETVPVLLVNGKPAADRYERATEYLRLSLNPYPPGAEPKYAPLRPKVISQSQFADMTDTDLSAYDAIYWCDVGAFGPGDLRRVETHLRRGGGLVVSLGDRAAENFEGYNRLLNKDDQGLLPCQLVKKIQAPSEHQFYLEAGKDAYLFPPLKSFSDQDDQNALRNARFKQFIEVKFSAEGRARTVLAFQPETLDEKTPLDKTLPSSSPALLEWNPPLTRAQQPGIPRPKDAGRPGLPSTRYRGKFILVTTTLNMDWTTWPGSPSFGAMMQEVTRLALSGRLHQQAATVGTLLEDFLPGGAESDVIVHFPASVTGLKPGKVRTQLVEDVNIFRWDQTDYSGLYRAVGDSGKELLFAVNVPARSGERGDLESDLARLDQARLRELYPGWEFLLTRDPSKVHLAEGTKSADVLEERAPVGPVLANIALVLVLILLFVEIVLAWQFGHYSSVEGATAPPATGLFWPLTIGILAVLCLTVGGWIIIHALYFGDFLGFLPDVLRAWLERALGVPPPTPGEGTHWDLEFQPFLHVLGNERWWAAALALAAGVLVFFSYRAEGPTVPKVYKALLGGLRLFLVLLTLWVLLPQLQLHFDRQGWPDLVVLIDTSRSMGEPDLYRDAAVLERSKQLGETVRKQLQDRLPARLKALQDELTEKSAVADKDAALRVEVEGLTQRLQYWEKQQELLGSTKWRPTRLQLVQALLTNTDNDWLQALVHKRKMKVHVYQLDGEGRASKLADADGPAGEVTDHTDPRLLQRARQAIGQLDPDGKDSRLGTAVRQVIDHYRGASLSGVVMFTDGVTTRDESIGQVSEYAAQKGVPLFLVGIGDDHEVRDLKLHDLQCDDNVYVNDTIQFEVRLTGQGYKDLVVPVVLKVKGKDGKEREVKGGRKMVKVDPAGKSIKIKFEDTPTEVGRRTYIIAVEAPRGDDTEKAPPVGNLRLERAIDVVDTKLIRVLYVEGQPRYEFRYLKFLLERENANEKEKKKRSIELKVVLLDADEEFAGQDRTALADFPATLDELNQYDVIILGDCDPRHKKLGEQRLKNIASFVRGEDEKGRKTSKSGGGLLLIAGAFFNPHSYKNTPLADVIPVEPLADKMPPEPANRAERLRPELTPLGRMHQIFRFHPDEAENLAIWQRLAPMYFYSRGYRLKPLAEVLAVHPTEKAAVQRGPHQDNHLPLVVQQFVGSGRSMFFGFDETWRWRLKEDEPRYIHFWVQTIRYLSRGRSTRTDLRLDRQTPYRLGEPIKVTVRFPDNLPGGAPGVKPGPPTEVRVTVEYRAGDNKDGPKEPEVQTLQLAKVEESWGTYEGALNRTREGKYRFRLISPDVSATQPDGEKPSAEAQVELPPGELDRLRMNEQELRQAGEATQGGFYNLVSAEQALEDVPPGVRVSLSAPTPPLLLWNQWFVFALVMFLLTSEWILRKRKHLL
jgi:hypothetical protein